MRAFLLPNNYPVFTDNNLVNALVYVSAIIFALSIFPVHLTNYVYLSTTENYASVNVTLYRYIRIYNANSSRKKIGDDKAGDGQKSINVSDYTGIDFLAIYNKLCITKIVQLGDYGLMKNANVYAALTQNALTQALYAFVRINGGRTKLRNYSILNYEHGDINYYLKLTGVINAMSFLKIFLIYLMGKRNERKT